MELIIHPKVADEMAEAAKWYRNIDPELCDRFLSEIHGAIHEAHEMPLRFRIIEKTYRRVLCETFPYRVVFEIIDELQAVHVVAVIHQMRHPDRWKKDL